MYFVQLAVLALVSLGLCLSSEGLAIIPERSGLSQRGLHARQWLESIDVGSNISTVQATILPLTLSSDRQ